jgi:hypothetical protein
MISRYLSVPLTAGLMACTAVADQPQNELATLGGTTPPVASPSTQPETVIGSVFGPNVALANDRATNVFWVDLTGDGVDELVALVTVRASLEDLPARINVTTPWAWEYVNLDDDHTLGAKTAIAIVHRGNGDQQGYLLYDPVVIERATNTPIVTGFLDTDAGRETFVLPRSQFGQLFDAEVAEMTRGGVIVVPTEAGLDSYLYWDGTAYRSYFPIDE